MTTKGDSVYVRLPADLARLVRAAAKADSRPISTWIRLRLAEAVKGGGK